jgi:hypothetical protein
MFTLVLVLTVIMIGPLLMERVERWTSTPTRRAGAQPVPLSSEVDDEAR